MDAKQLSLFTPTFQIGDRVQFRNWEDRCGVVIPRPDLDMCWYDIQRRDVLSDDPEIVFLMMGEPPSWNWHGWLAVEAWRLENCDEIKYPIELADLPKWQERWRREAAKSKAH